MLPREIAIQLCMQILESNTDISQLTIDVAKLFKWWNNVEPEVQDKLKADHSVLYAAIGYNNFVNEVITTT